jgi:integrase
LQAGHLQADVAIMEISGRKGFVEAREWRLISEVPVLKLRKAAGRQLLFSMEDEAGILKHASQDVQDVFIQVQDTGMRPNEVFKTKWQDVFFNENCIWVPESKTEAGRARSRSQRV